VTDTARLERADVLLRQAQLRLGRDRAGVYLLIDTALESIEDEIRDRVFKQTCDEITALVDIHGLIDDVGADFDADRKGWA
jgi:hypothetical protein